MCQGWQPLQWTNVTRSQILDLIKKLSAPLLLPCLAWPAPAGAVLAVTTVTAGWAMTSWVTCVLCVLSVAGVEMLVWCWCMFAGPPPDHD